MILVAGAACRRAAAPPYSPADALARFRIAPGFRIERFAAEPAVVSPVAMDWDENGNIYVVEDRGYPLNVAGKVGRVKLLRDTDGDGIPDRTTVFADRLVLPTSVMRWKKGVLVLDPPDLWYMEDTDGDGKADIKRLVLTGFPFTNPQHTANGLVYGLDNWIYIAHEHFVNAVIFKKEFGDPGSTLRYVDRPNGQSIPEPARNVRIRPDTGEIEALSSSSQFGQSFDDYGRHFVVGNSNHVRMETIAARYLLRNPDLPLPSAVEDISDHGPAAKVFPITANPRFEMLSGVGIFTSACGICWYRGSTFVAEPVHNIVHRDLLSENGALYLARRDREGAEFLASTDPWFRPVNLAVGPEGAMYLLDYYRMIIEHPEWMATGLQHSPDLYKGIEYGRIYRIVPDSGFGPPRPARLGSASNDELVRQLANPSIWYRRTAQRLLVDRRAIDAAPALARLFQESPSPQGRVHALWTLEGLGALDPRLIRKALADPEPGVRENAVILAEQHVDELAPALLNMAGDSSPRVRFQLVLTLGNVKTPASREVRQRLLFRDLEDRWMQLAALSADSADAPPLFRKIMSGQATEGRATLVRYLAAVIASRRKAPEIDRAIAELSSSRADALRTAGLEGLAQGIRAHHALLPPGAGTRILAVFEHGDPSARRAALAVLQEAGLPPGSGPALSRAAAAAADPHAGADRRADSLALVALAEPARNASLFQSLIDPHQPEAVQAAAVRAYGRVPGDAPGVFLIRHWRTFTAPVRNDAGNALNAEPGRQKLLIAALRSGDVQPWTLGFGQKIRLIMNPDPEVRAAARPLLEQPPGGRAAVLRRYQAALDMKADPAAGQHVFETICSKCHRLNGRGHDFGPDLGTVRNQPKEVLLTDILVPSQSIAQGYEAYVVETRRGGILDGVIGAQTPSAITLKHENGSSEIIPREEIRNMYATNLSAMPADLDKQVTVEQMAGLLEFLKSGK